MNQSCPEIAIRSEVDIPARLLDRVQNGSLDLAVLYSPPPRAGLVSELLLEEKLIMVTTDPDGEVDPERYVYVDWGPHFLINHQAAHPELSNPALSISLGPLASHLCVECWRCRLFSCRHGAAIHCRWSPATRQGHARIFALCLCGVCHAT